MWRGVTPLMSGLHGYTVPTLWETFARRVRIIKVWIWANVLYLGKFHPKIVDEGPNLALFLY